MNLGNTEVLVTDLSSREWSGNSSGLKGGPWPQRQQNQESSCEASIDQEEEPIRNSFPTRIHSGSNL